MEPVTTSYETIAPVTPAAQEAVRLRAVLPTGDTGSDGSSFHPGRDRSQAALVTAGLLSAGAGESEAAGRDAEAPAPETAEAAESERVLKPYGIAMLPAEDPEGA